VITLTMQNVLLPNATITTARSTHNNSTGDTPAPTAYATINNVHIMPVHQMDFKMLPEAALVCDWCITCDTGTDFEIGDVVTSITSNNLNWPAQNNPNPHELITANLVLESTPGAFLQHRQVFVKRAVIGGPVSA